MTLYEIAYEETLALLRHTQWISSPMLTAISIATRIEERWKEEQGESLCSFFDNTLEEQDVERD